MTKETRAALVATATEIIHRRCGHVPVRPADIEANCVCRTAAAEVISAVTVAFREKGAGPTREEVAAVSVVHQLRSLLREWVGGLQKRHGLRKRTMNAIDDTKDWEP